MCRQLHDRSGIKIAADLLKGFGVMGFSLGVRALSQIFSAPSDEAMRRRRICFGGPRNVMISITMSNLVGLGYHALPKGEKVRCFLFVFLLVRHVFE